MRASLPKNEKKRLKVLWEYGVLDTVPEEVFDDLTELAARICEAPIALITLVDEDRQWFKSKVGVSVNEIVPKSPQNQKKSSPVLLYCTTQLRKSVWLLSIMSADVAWEALAFTQSATENTW